MSPPGAERSECEKPRRYIFFSTPRKRVTGLAKEVQRTSGFIPIKTTRHSAVSRSCVLHKHLPRYNLSVLKPFQSPFELWRAMFDFYVRRLYFQTIANG